MEMEMGRSQRRGFSRSPTGLTKSHSRKERLGGEWRVAGGRRCSFLFLLLTHRTIVNSYYCSIYTIYYGIIVSIIYHLSSIHHIYLYLYLYLYTILSLYSLLYSALLCTKVLRTYTDSSPKPACHPSQSQGFSRGKTPLKVHSDWFNPDYPLPHWRSLRFAPWGKSESFGTFGHCYWHWTLPLDWDDALGTGTAQKYFICYSRQPTGAQGAYSVGCQS
jgi:hypothetical protein